MMMSGRSRAAPGSRVPADGTSHDSSKTEIPSLQEFFRRRDYVGATTLLTHRVSYPETNDDTTETSEHPHTTLEWLAYAHFHGGDPGKALLVYRQLLDADGGDTDGDTVHENKAVLHTFAAACLFYLGRYDDAVAEAAKGPDTKLKTRILFHCAHKKGDEQLLTTHHENLSDSLEDQLSLAAVHYARGHYQEAVDIYKRLLLEDANRHALNVYVALCYHKLEYFDVSLELLDLYLSSAPDSIVAVNLKACNVFKLRDGRDAEKELTVLGASASDEPPGDDVSENDLVKHNRVVFRGGEDAKRAWTPLLGNPTLPEARLNLCVFHLNNGDAFDAFQLLKDCEPATPHEYILKGVTHAVMGQMDATEFAEKNGQKNNSTTDQQEHLKRAQQCFQIVGASANECDTIPGRQSMASCFLLLEQHDDALVYLKSVSEFSKQDDDFHWNHGMASSAVGDWKTGLDELRAVRDGKYTNELPFKVWLAKCLVRNGKAPEAWTLCEETAGGGDLETEDEASLDGAQNDLLYLLQVVADECYLVGEFYVAMRAFDELERLSDSDAFWVGKRGAAVGVFANVVAGKEPRETLADVVALLRQVNTTEADTLLLPVLEWARGEGIRVE